MTRLSIHAPHACRRPDATVAEQDRGPRSHATLVLLALALLVNAAVANATSSAQPVAQLPQPVSIKPWVDFWIRIYGERHDGVLTLHDARDVSVVYAVLETPPGQSLNARHERAKHEIEAFQRALHELADGRNKASSPYQDRVRWLWGERPDPGRLREAARHIRMQVGHADTFRAALPTARLWRPWINRVLDAHGLPRELGAIPFVESFFRNDVAPDSGARGIWQFIVEAGRRDMHIGTDIDERMSLYKSTLAAARLLSHHYAITRRWPLAVTAYNHGTRGVVRAVRELHTRDLGIIARRYRGPGFGFASRNFYAQVLAAAHVESNRDHYFGGTPTSTERPRRFALLLESAQSLNDVSKTQNISIKGLQEANPELLSSTFEARGKLPAGLTLWVNCVEDCPSPTGGERKGKPQSANAYTVQTGDTLSHIAMRMNTTVAELARVNKLIPDSPLQIGLQLAVPGPSDKPDYIRFPSELSFDGPYDGEPSARYQAPGILPAHFDNSVALRERLQTTRPAPPPAGAGTVHLPDAKQYKLLHNGRISLLHGESTGLIARWLDLDTASLHRLNKLPEGALLAVGQQLQLPFTHVHKAEFERRRLQHHRDRQYAWYQNWYIDGTVTYTVKPGDRLWQIADRQYKVPQWLLLEYNPAVDFNRVRPGELLLLPRVRARQKESGHETS